MLCACDVQNVDRFRYKLYAPSPIHIEAQNGLAGFCLLTRFIRRLMLRYYDDGFSRWVLLGGRCVWKLHNVGHI